MRKGEKTMPKKKNFLGGMQNYDPKTGEYEPALKGPNGESPSGFKSFKKEKDESFDAINQKRMGKPSIDYEEIERRKTETPEDSYNRMQEQWRKERAELGGEQLKGGSNNENAEIFNDYKEEYAKAYKEGGEKGLKDAVLKSGYTTDQYNYALEQLKGGSGEETDYTYSDYDKNVKVKTSVYDAFIENGGFEETEDGKPIEENIKNFVTQGNYSKEDIDELYNYLTEYNNHSAAKMLKETYEKHNNNNKNDLSDDYIHSKYHDEIKVKKSVYDAFEEQVGWNEETGKIKNFVAKGNYSKQDLNDLGDYLEENNFHTAAKTIRDLAKQKENNSFEETNNKRMGKETPKAEETQEDKDFNSEIKKTADDIRSSGDRYTYMMLDRLRSDAEYVLDKGKGAVNQLWYNGDPKKHIALMKDLHNGLKNKPEWLSMEKINEYEKKFNDLGPVYVKDNDRKKLTKAGFSLDDTYSGGDTYEIYDKDTGRNNSISLSGDGKYYYATINGTVYYYKDLDTAIDRATYKSGKAPSNGAIGWENGSYDGKKVEELWGYESTPAKSTSAQPLNDEGAQKLMREGSSRALSEDEKKQLKEYYANQMKKYGL